MKNCPHCSGEIRDSVIRCNHCGLDPRAPVGTVAPPPEAVAPAPIAPGVTAPSIPVSGQFTPAVPPAPSTPPSPAGDQPQYFAMKTDLTPPGTARSSSGSVSPSGGDPATSAFIAGILGLVGAAIAGFGLLKMPLLTATWGGTMDLGADMGGPQQIPSDKVDLMFGQWDGLAKTLMTVATVGAVVFAIMVLTNPSLSALSRLLGQGILMTVTSAWIFALLSGLKQDLMDVFHSVLSLASSQMPADTFQQLQDQADGLLAMKTGLGFWMIALGSLLVLGGSIFGAMAIKKAMPSSKF